ncbi:hypothetical protein PHYSODRAFT_481659 [Phytophthora sojae]|uniref:PX domain-containing protein n=1 Tax=Phytophthora sojae (strain P6497) TaxID=1094619 RepID=G4YW94_PHYSP|nr:hypothetical protein PHYSODRAFT_481659 [Phytophthora sojae]EGZ24984.1 hypothetical protein PHYSODRAFT_481659 [Phytophthora sojae]|eukprot:XP_009520272.1 hypothetical protein PHYSODRAFT_481659 [Phytophthora sojae]
MRLPHWLLALAALLLGARYSWTALLLLRGCWWTATRLLQLGVLLVGSGSFWWVLRSYQLQKEQELLDQALLKFKYYNRYRSRVGSGTHGGAVGPLGGGPRSSGSAGGDYALSPPASGAYMTDAGFQLRVLKRLPIVAHLRTSWSLPPEICDEIAALVQLIVKDYVNFWFQAISPNEEFPNDVKFLLADLLGAVASRVLEIDPSQALTMVAKSLELLRLHLGWFREAYAQLADEYPSVFEGDDNDANLLKRQEYVTSFVQRSPFVHPGCVATGTPSSPQATNAEAAYLRHVAVQLLTQLRPQLGQQHDTNVFVSIAMNLLREIVAFKILKPLSEYSQPRYANEVVLACLQAIVDDKNDTGPISPTMSGSGNGVAMMPTLSLNKLRSTSSYLYKASRRSGEQAEAAFQGFIEAVASGVSSAAAGAAEMVFEGEDWTDSNNPFAFGSAVFAASSGGSTGEKKAMPSIFMMDDRLNTNVAKAAKMMNPRGLIPGGLLSHKMTGESSRISTHMDDLKNAKANIGTSLNTSIGKVKRRFRMEPISAPPLNAGAAARMIRKPGQLLQKAWKRGESGVSSPTSSFDDGAVTPTGDSRGRSNAHTMGSLNPLLIPMSDDEEEASARTASGSIKMAVVRDRVVVHLEKAVASYVKLYDECPEMRNSARSRELYELLSAMEDVFMLGFRNPDSKAPILEDDVEHKELSTPPLSPVAKRRSSVPMPKLDLDSPRRDSMSTDRGSDSDGEDDDNQYYWDYLSRDRLGAGQYNAHWRFVASQCPHCCPSESHVSTRGVQWMLVALEKGLLGFFCTELYAHSDITELFYEDFCLLNDSKLMESWRAQGATSPSAPVRVLERVWEIERYVPTKGWVKATDKRWQELPSSEWIWEDDWALENTGNDAGESSDSETPNSAWEYAKTFEDTFHGKEKKFDSVRRRRWIRRRCQLPPVLALPTPPVSPNGFGVSSPLASSTVPNGLGRARKLKQRFNALKRDKNYEKGTTAKSLLRRRSKSFDKDMPDSPIRDSLLEADDLQQMSRTASALMKARASIPSLRRGISNRSTKSTATDSGLSTKTSVDDDPAALYENDDEDEENLCFRCLKMLPVSKSGAGTCHSCHQRVCATCLDFYAFMVYPPPLETSKKARVCGNCYDRLVKKYKLRIDAHVGKFLVKERERESSESFSSSSSNRHPSSPLSPTISRAGSTKFEITVKVKDDNAYAWSVIKTFHDFEVLEKQLADKLKKQEKKCGVGCQTCHLRGVDYMEMNTIKPSLKTVAAATMTYEKRLYVLEQFLQQLLACDTLCQSSVVQKFLLLSNAYGTSLAAGNTAGGMLVENGKWKKGRWIAPDANSKETKMRVLQKIEVSLFAMLGEVFEFDGIGMVRRQIFSMTRSFIKAFLGASHFRMLERQFLSFTDPKKLSGWIGDLRLYIFPDPSDSYVPPLPAPDMRVLREECLAAIAASFPSKAVSLFGDTACSNAALKLHEFLQHEVFVKNLLFSITDELLLHLFPESTTFKGKKAPGGTPAAPSPMSPSAIKVATTIALEAVAASIDDDAAAGLLTPPLSPVPSVPVAAEKKTKVVI